MIYIKLGVDHLFIYDDNEPNTERISDAIDDKYKSKITFNEDIKGISKNQIYAYNDCYQKNSLDYDWFLMIDFDEFLFIIYPICITLSILRKILQQEM